jgi:transcriptional regulator with XRE-family HTH domain
MGLVIRALRIRRGWRQSDLARAARCSQQTISVLERGHVEMMPLELLRAIAIALEARVEYDLRWRGGAIDRLLDARHSELVGVVVRRLHDAEWEPAVEVSYSHFGERGSIDVLGWHKSSRTLAVVEVKSVLASLEETLRRHDVKVRLATMLGAERWSERAAAVGRLLVLPDDSTSRRLVRAADPVLRAALPGDGEACRGWLAHPHGPFAGIWFLSPTSGRIAKQRPVTSERVRRRKSGQSLASLGSNLR